MKGLNLLLGVVLGLSLAGCAKSGGKGDDKPVAQNQCVPFKTTGQVQALGTGVFSGHWKGQGVLEDGLNSESCAEVNFEIYQDPTHVRVNTAQLSCESRCLNWGKSEFQIQGTDIYLGTRKVGEVISPSVLYIEFQTRNNTKYNLIFQRNGQTLEIRDLREYWVNRKTSFLGTTSTLRKVQ